MFGLPRTAFVLAIAAAAVSGPALAQSFSCSLNAPAHLDAGQSATLSFTATNTGTTALSSSGSVSDDILFGIQLSMAFGSDQPGTFSHIHATTPQSSDPQFASCIASPNSSTATLYLICSNPSLQAASIAAGASVTITSTLSVDPGAPSAGIQIFSDIQQGANGICNKEANLSIGNTCTTAPLSAPAVAQSNQNYTVSWARTFPDPVYYELDESTTSDFSANVTTHTPGGTQQTFNKNVNPALAVYYRVRTHDCNGSPGPYSNTVKVIVQAPLQPVSGPADVTVPFGSTTPVSVPVSITSATAVSFHAAVDRPFLSVTPANGSISAGGSTVLTVTANPSSLPPGANTGTLTVTSTSGATVASVPISISLVTPVLPGTKTSPLPGNTLIIPVITHVNGAGAVFESDVRLTNGSASTVNYQLLLTPTRSDGTQTGVQTTVSVAPGQTIAFNDIAKDFFGFGATGAPGDQGFGALQIIPLNTSALTTFASSRTYAVTGNGTFGQFVPVTPLSSFATQGQVLSLQHVAQSSAFHTNLGLVEGSGASASGRVRIIDDTGTVLQTVPFSLQPGEHQQNNQFISANGVASLTDGRLEVVVDSLTGAVTAYASVLDNTTQDPYAVAPVRATLISATRYVTPGVADLNNGAANFHSDLRVYNGGATSQSVTLTFYPQGAPGSPLAAPPMTIGAGQVAAIDNVIPTLFPAAANKGGSVLITTPSPSSLVATVRTYSNASGGGTFGQFIPGVSPSQGVGTGDRGLEVLQLEQSAAFRSNIGVAELTGNPAHVRMTLVLPDSKVAPTTEFDLAPNEFRQFGSVILSMNPGQENTYNARMIVEVTSGSGRVTAYGSVLDNRTQDPTYVPGQ